MNCLKVIIRSLFIFFLIAFSTESQSKLSASEEFSRYQSLLKLGSTSSLRKFLKEDTSFIQENDSDSWIKNDSTGVIRVSLSGDLGGSVMFIPSKKLNIGDEALAAIIEKSDTAYLSGGDSMELIFEYDLKKAYFSQHITISLIDGSILRTSSSIDYK